MAVPMFGKLGLDNPRAWPMVAIAVVCCFFAARAQEPPAGVFYDELRDLWNAVKDAKYPVSDGFTLGAGDKVASSHVENAVLRDLLLRGGRPDLIGGKPRQVLTDQICKEKLVGSSVAEVLHQVSRRFAAFDVVVLNEDHRSSEDRFVLGELVGVLKPAGYTQLALEALKTDRLDRVSGQIDRLPSGLDEPQFAKAIEAALARDVGIIGYPSTVAWLLTVEAGNVSAVNVGALIAAQNNIERERAEKLAELIRKHRKKTLVYVGLDHVRRSSESSAPLTNQVDWLAGRLSRLGLRVASIDQTRFTSNDHRYVFCATSDETFQRVGTDFLLARPLGNETSFDSKAVRVTLPIKKNADELLLVEAQRMGATLTGPLARTLALPGEAVNLNLRKGSYWITVWNKDGRRGTGRLYVKGKCCTSDFVENPDP